jgi:hypothetical protein
MCETESVMESVRIIRSKFARDIDIDATMTIECETIFGAMDYGES